jgi:uncharacterized protein YecE (DUF72 family)
MSQIHIGTSGWSYPTGKGTWNGVFYPAPAGGRGRRGRFDELAFYAEHFDTVEINSTFYRVPAVEVTRSWARRTPAGFEFAAKLFQKFTHPAMFEQAAHGEENAVSLADVDQFKAALDPLASAGKLGPLLAQFPPSFKREPASADYVDWLLRAFRGYPIAVELRHRSWSDALAQTLDLLNGHGAAWVQIDEPKFRFSIRQDLSPNLRTFAYLRLHGRNAAAWWEHQASEDRYNYLYTDDELRPFSEAVIAARRLVRKLYLYMNNHFEAKAVANAVMLQHQLGEPIAGAYPENFLARFPALRGIAPGTPAAAPATSDLLGADE